MLRILCRVFLVALVCVVMAGGAGVACASTMATATYTATQATPGVCLRFFEL